MQLEDLAGITSVSTAIADFILLLFPQADVVLL